MTYGVYDFFRYSGGLEGQVRYADPAMDSVAYFQEDEIGHMEDVRELLKNILIIFCICLLLFIATFTLALVLNRDNAIRRAGLVLIWSSASVLIVFLLLQILSANFSALFDNFHSIFFPQGNYMFPAGSLLITMFPFGFFYQFFLRLALTSTIIAGCILVSGIALAAVGRRTGR